MVESAGYVPVLLTKRGERTALKDLSAGARAAMTPLFVVDPIPWDHDNDEEAKTIDEHLDGKPDELVDAWGGDPAFVDLLFIDDAPVASGEHPLVWFTRECRSRGLPIVPVVGIERTPAYRTAAADVVSRDGDGACVRLGIDEWPSGASGDLDDLLDELGLDPEEVDLVLDMADEVSSALADRVLRGELSALPYVDDWRSLVLTGAGLPKTMPAGRGVHVLDRFEWALYERLVIHRPPARIPTFGDYAIAHPDPFLEVNPKFMSIAATIRYTAADHWLIAKGGLFKASGGRGLGGAAVPPTARDLAAHPDFTSGHCPGEDWVEAAASGGPTGNSETWRRWGTLHHLELVPSQLATLHGP